MVMTRPIQTLQAAMMVCRNCQSDTRKYSSGLQYIGGMFANLAITYTICTLRYGNIKYNL